MEFKCKQCGQCCKTVGEIAGVLPLQLLLILQPNKNGHCQHLGYKNGKAYCRIYNTRPDICRVSEMASMRAKHLGISKDDAIRITQNACDILRQEEG